jgi:hypothetical protein
VDDAAARRTVLAAYQTYSAGELPTGIEAARVPVSTNRVYRLTFASSPSVYAKLSSYGSFIHFRQDHQRIEQWRRLLSRGRYASFLAPVLSTDEDVFMYHAGEAWVAFYGEVPTRASLPRVLSEEQVESFALAMARWHRACSDAARALPPTWKTVGSDIAILFDVLASDGWLKEHRIDRSEARYVRDHCNLFLKNADRLGYFDFSKMPVLIDWNIGNFSVTGAGPEIELFSRWDYDWFRIEPRALDFYSLSRVVSQIGDRTIFSYGARTFLDPRFTRFLRAYQSVFPLGEAELRFVKEAYRFFILNYVILSGQHFFQPALHERLLREAIDQYLPELDRLDFTDVFALTRDQR